MSQTSPNNTQASVYRRGAEDGLKLGIYFSVLIVSMLLTVKIAALSLVSLVLIAGVPFLCYRYIRRDVRCRPGGGRFSEAWMHGIAMFFFGALIMGVVMYLYLHFFDPSYIVTNVRQTIAVLRELGGDENIEMAKDLQQLIDLKLLPGTTQLVFSSIWLVVFTGSLLSMLLSAFAINNERRHCKKGLS